MFLYFKQRQFSSKRHKPNWLIRQKCVHDGPIVVFNDGKLSDCRNVDLVAFEHVLGFTAGLPGHV